MMSFNSYIILEMTSCELIGRGLTARFGTGLEGGEVVCWSFFFFTSLVGCFLS